jgi:hypothetical protein
MTATILPLTNTVGLKLHNIFPMCIIIERNLDIQPRCVGYQPCAADWPSLF